MKSNPKLVVIAVQEVRRLRARFRGRSSPLVAFLLLGALFVSYMGVRQRTTGIAGVYRLGLSPNGPVVESRRFIITELPPQTGRAQVAAGLLDVYVDGEQILVGESDRAQYALGALQKILAAGEQRRIAAEYPPDVAFPLRLQIFYVPVDATSTGTNQGILAATSAAASGTPDAAADPALPAADGSTYLETLGLQSVDLYVPSLSEPPIPFTQVIIAFLYVMPVAFISVFFISSFLDEKLNRRIGVLLAAPLHPLEIILGKMLPYFTFAMLAIVVITIVLNGNILLALAILTPLVLVLLGVYLLVAVFSRSYRDTTFMSMLATTGMTTLLIMPAMFSGVNNLSYLSPLTLVVKLYRGESFGLQAYLFSALPMLLFFVLCLYVGTSVFEEQFLTSYRTFRHKLADALRLSIDMARPYRSVFLMSLLVIPLVFLIQLAVLAVSLNLPLQLALLVLLFVSILVEELAKSITIVVWYQPQEVRPWKPIMLLSLVSAVGFFVGEKGLLALSLNVVSAAPLSAAIFGPALLIVPLLAHFLFTTLVTTLNSRFQVRYPLAVLAGATLHMIYNLYVVGAVL